MSLHEQLEKSIADALQDGDHGQAATRVLESLGGEILGYLIGRLRSEQAGREVFAIFAEDLWRALPNLTLRTSMRAYAYALARNAAYRYLAREVRPGRRLMGITDSFDIEAAARTVTPTYLRTDTKSAMARLRASLDDDEQALLTLRVDRDLEWLELAEVFAEQGEDLTKVSARLRKRFEAVKKKLARLAREEGLL